MNKLAVLLLFAFAAASCRNDQPDPDNGERFDKLAALYWEESLKLYPLSATYIGDNRYNDRLPNDGSQAFIKNARAFNHRFLDSLNNYAPSSLSASRQLSYAMMKNQIETALQGFQYRFEYMPFNQMSALPLTFAQLGAGTGAQPFKTVKDYDNWLKRADAFAVWADTAIGNFRKGMTSGLVLPRTLVLKMIPQLKSMQVSRPAESLFYGPVNKLPDSFPPAEKSRIKTAYAASISNVILPAYRRLADFLEQEYLPRARSSSGLSAVPGGKEMYTYLVRQQTTTTRTPEEIYQTGLTEVSRIRKQMDSIRLKVGFKGTIQDFFTYMNTSQKFMPYKTPAEVLAAFGSIRKRMEPNLPKMFAHKPKTPFEIRQTEAFRAASASAEYNPGSADGSRPGIFYVPILDATKFNITSGMESLFLHEAIPGHHYQISLTQENTQLPAFRRFGWNNAYVEGWALYCESLGKELGLYQDPYQHMGALGDEMHRAIRLVVDVAIHMKGMSREAAIRYMMENEAISKEAATAEIERYMGIPAQALGYKTGAMKISELRNKYQRTLGTKFKLAAFHDAVLKDGSLPLSVFEQKMDTWADSQ
ncbi:DUF885 domain-containing protein [Pedobacter yulinensis]|uniref:DUF885 domain-containing protein n=1 Tax=Pedobacter yulinensis TaxID=2126353 RepID=A0A2T3HQW8_9SPHI|nr:DUF885 domain-containing protein [Pedobacter yulinensis]PST84854.1 DUF885 domain-containing protein [Pedobacter yulinensis]